MTQVLKSLISSFILPPAGLVILGVLGIFLFRSRKKFAKILIVFSLLGQLALAFPIVGNNLIHGLEKYPPLNPDILPQTAKALVILGCGIHKNPPEFSTHALTHCALERVTYGAYLAKKTQLPILTTGGGGTADPSATEGRVMSRFLESEWHIPVTWIENMAHNSKENAENTAAILFPLGIRDVVLITHAWHMPRAKWAFEQVGFTVTPASTCYTYHPISGLQNYVPDIDSYVQSYTALREYLGQIFYRLEKGVRP